MRRQYLLTGLIIILLGTVGLAVTAVWLLLEPTYTIFVDESPITVTGRFDTVEDVLAAADLEVNPADIVTPALTKEPFPDNSVQIERAQEVLLKSEAGSHHFWTHQTTLGAFFAEIEYYVDPTHHLFGDERRIDPADIANTPLPQIVEVMEFIRVVVHDNGQTQFLSTKAATVGALLEEANITIYSADLVEPASANWLTPDLEIIIRRSMAFSIRADGRLIQIRSYHTDVHEVLSEAGVELVGEDYTRPAASELLQPGSTIEVIRVTEDFRLVDDPIAYDIIWMPTDQLEIDSTALLQSGQTGVNRTRFRVRFENGVAVSEVEDGQWVVEEASTEIWGYGTKIVLRTIQTEEGLREYWRVVRMRVTSYTAASSGKPPDHPAYGITRSGLPAGTGVVAVDMSVVPWLSDIFVPGYGIGIAGDTGGGIIGRWIDLGYDEDEFIAWSGYVDVYYLTPVPNEIVYRLPANLP